MGLPIAAPTNSQPWGRGFCGGNYRGQKKGNEGRVSVRRGRYFVVTNISGFTL